MIFHFGISLKVRTYSADFELLESVTTRFMNQTLIFITTVFWRESEEQYVGATF